MNSPDRFEADENPLADDAPEAWDRLVQALGPASMLVCIRQRMGPRLTEVFSPEDLWQETLLSVWRDRSRCEWRGVELFRRWVLSVVENVLRNAADRIGAVKRGGGKPRLSIDQARGTASQPSRELPPLVSSTTPSRVASDLEESRAMMEALSRIPDELREVVRLRLFEEWSVTEVAAALELGESAVKHRFRKGSGLYHEQLHRLLRCPRPEE